MAKELSCWADYPDFMTISQTQQLLNVGRATVYRWIEAGVLPGAIQFGDTWRISREMLKRQVWLLTAGKHCEANRISDLPGHLLTLPILIRHELSWIVVTKLIYPELSSQNTALLVIDMSFDFLQLT